MRYCCATFHLLPQGLFKWGGYRDRARCLVHLHSVHFTLKHKCSLGFLIANCWQAQRQAQYIWLSHLLWALWAHLILAVELDGAADKMCNQCLNYPAWTELCYTVMEHKDAVVHNANETAQRHCASRWIARGRSHVLISPQQQKNASEMSACDQWRWFHK